MTVDLLHNKIVKETITEAFEKSVNDNLIPKLYAIYGVSLDGIQMYEDYINDEFMKDGFWYYPLTVIIGGVNAVIWIKWDVSNRSLFANGNPYAYHGEEIDFLLADDVPIAFKKSLDGRSTYFKGECVKLNVTTDAPNVTFLAGKYSQTFIDEMAKQITSAISKACGVKGIEDSSIEIDIVFAPNTYMEHTSENVTYRRLLISAKGCAPRDFWIKWTRLNSSVAYSVNDNVSGDDIVFEIGEDVSHKTREKEYRFLVYGNSDKYKVAMGRKSITEWRELIKRAVKRGELTKVMTDLESDSHVAEVSDKLSEILEKCGVTVPSLDSSIVGSNSTERANEALRMAVLGEGIDESEIEAEVTEASSEAPTESAPEFDKEYPQIEFKLPEGIELTMNESESDESNFLLEMNKIDATEADATTEEENETSPELSDEITVNDVDNEANAPAVAEEAVPTLDVASKEAEEAISDNEEDDLGIIESEGIRIEIEKPEREEPTAPESASEDTEGVEEVPESVEEVPESVEEAPIQEKTYAASAPEAVADYAEEQEAFVNGAAIIEAEKLIAALREENERLMAEVSRERRVLESERLLREETEKQLNFERLHSSDLRAQIEKDKFAIDEVRALVEEANNAKAIAEAEAKRLRAENETFARENRQLVEACRAAEEAAANAEENRRLQEEELLLQIELSEKERTREKLLFAEAARQAKEESERIAAKLADEEAARRAEEERIEALRRAEEERIAKEEAERAERARLAEEARLRAEQNAKRRAEAVERAKETRRRMEEQARENALRRIKDSEEYAPVPEAVALKEPEPAEEEPSLISMHVESVDLPEEVASPYATEPVAPSLESLAEETASMPTEEKAPVSYTYTSKIARLMFKNRIDPNITSRIHELITKAITEFHKEDVYIKVKASMPDNTTVVLNFVEIPDEEFSLLVDLIKYLGKSDLGIYKAILE